MVDGPFGRAGSGDDAGNRPSTVKAKVATMDAIDNNSVSALASKCSRGQSIFGGGYTVGGSPWPHASSSAVLSQDNAFSTELVHLPFNPTLGVLRQQARLRVLSLCAKDTGRLC